LWLQQTGRHVLSWALGGFLNSEVMQNLGTPPAPPTQITSSAHPGAVGQAVAAGSVG
jgi:hypothetical protein